MHVPGHLHSQIISCSLIDLRSSPPKPVFLDMLTETASSHSSLCLRLQSLKEGLTAEQRLHLFDNKDTKDF